MKIKKILFAILLFMIIIYTKDTYAFSLGVSNQEEYEGVMYSDEVNNIITHSGAKSPIVVEYGNFWGDDEDLSKINVQFSLASGYSITSTEARANEGNHVISGSNNNYNITFGDSYPDGDGIFVVKVPSPSKTTDSSITVTATSYGKNNEVLDTKTMTVKYYILVKNTSCDSNYDATLNTSAGKPTKVGTFLGDNYAFTTTQSSLDITLSPKSSKTKVYGVFEDNITELSGGKQSNVNLSIGDNGFMYIVKSECARDWENTFNMITGAFIVDTNLDDYSYSPNLVTLSITREEKKEEPKDSRSAVNTLKTLTVSDVKFTFKSDVRSYVLSVPNKTDSITIKSTLTDSKSSYVEGFGNRTVKLNEGENEVLIKVKAENGSEGVYTLKIAREKSDDSTLKTLKVNDKEVKIVKDTLQYTVYVENNITKASIKADSNDKNAKVEISELKELVVGTNKVKITVTAASGKKSIYEITVVRDKEVSVNSKLKSLTIGNYSLDFHGDVFEYSLHIDKKVKELDITAKPENEKATVEIIGNKKLKNGSVIKVKVTAQDKKTVTTYEIKIDKQSSNLLWIILGLVVIAGIVGFVFYKKKQK